MSNNKFEDLSEEDLVAELDKGIESDEQLGELLEAMEKKGMKGGLIGFNQDDVESMDCSIEYIEYHEKLAKPEPDEKIVKESIAILRKKEVTGEELKFAIINLAHSGRVDALRALEKYAKNASGDLATWSQIAIGECQMFLESKLEDNPSIKIREVKKNAKNQ